MAAEGGLSAVLTSTPQYADNRLDFLSARLHPLELSTIKLDTIVGDGAGCVERSSDSSHTALNTKGVHPTSVHSILQSSYPFRFPKIPLGNSYPLPPPSQPQYTFEMDNADSPSLFIPHASHRLHLTTHSSPLMFQDVSLIESPRKTVPRQDGPCLPDLPPLRSEIRVAPSAVSSVTPVTRGTIADTLAFRPYITPSRKKVGLLECPNALSLSSIVPVSSSTSDLAREDNINSFSCLASASPDANKQTLVNSNPKPRICLKIKRCKIQRNTGSKKESISVGKDVRVEDEVIFPEYGVERMCCSPGEAVPDVRTSSHTHPESLEKLEQNNRLIPIPKSPVNQSHDIKTMKSNGNPLNSNWTKVAGNGVLRRVKTVTIPSQAEASLSPLLSPPSPAGPRRRDLMKVGCDKTQCERGYRDKTQCEHRIERVSSESEREASNLTIVEQSDAIIPTSSMPYMETHHPHHHHGGSGGRNYATVPETHTRKSESLVRLKKIENRMESQQVNETIKNGGDSGGLKANLEVRNGLNKPHTFMIRDILA